MAPSDDLLDSDLDAQLRGLFHEAEQAIGSKGQPTGKADLKREPGEIEASAAPSSTSPAATPGSTRVWTDSTLLQLLKPLVLGFQAVSRATGENTATLKKLEAAVVAEKPVKNKGDSPQLIDDLRALLDSKNTVSQGMFSALHDELKGYKDDFLLQAIHRPIIRDLMTVYDDVAEIERQVNAFASVTEEERGENLVVNAFIARLRQIQTNVANNLHFLLEVLHRLDVTLLPVSSGKLDKLTQRAVSIENTANADEDGLVVRAVKRGFLWRGGVLRPEEVVIKKWKATASDEGAEKTNQ